MAFLCSSHYHQASNDVLDRQNLGTVTNTIEGGGVTWVANSTHIAVAPDITVLNYDPSRNGEYNYGGNGGDRKPHIIIKGTADFRTYNVKVLDEAGNTLYTFDANNATNPTYCVLRLVTGHRDSVSWELA
jgi:hypothetical protein